MRRRNESSFKKDNFLKSAVETMMHREFAAMSEYLSASIACEKDYPELSVWFDSAAAERYNNAKRFGGMLESFGGSPSLNLRASLHIAHKEKIKDVIQCLTDKESCDVVDYQKIYLLDSDDRFDFALKEILRASRDRLSMLQSILRS